MPESKAVSGRILLITSLKNSSKYCIFKFYVKIYRNFRLMLNIEQTIIKKAMRCLICARINEKMNRVLKDEVSESMALLCFKYIQVLFVSEKLCGTNQH